MKPGKNLLKGAALISSISLVAGLVAIRAGMMSPPVPMSLSQQRAHAPSEGTDIGKETGISISVMDGTKSGIGLLDLPAPVLPDQVWSNDVPTFSAPLEAMKVTQPEPDLTVMSGSKSFVGFVAIPGPRKPVDIEPISAGHVRNAAAMAGSKSSVITWSVDPMFSTGNGILFEAPPRTSSPAQSPRPQPSGRRGVMAGSKSIVIDWKAQNGGLDNIQPLTIPAASTNGVIQIGPNAFDPRNK